MSYNPGQSITLTSVVATPGGVATDPTAAALLILRPDGERFTYLSSTGWASQGNWSAATNTPTLADGTGTAGHYYTVTAAGSVNFGVKALTFEVGDRVYYDGDYWRRLTGVQAGTLTHSADGTFSYIYPIPDVGGNYYYGLIAMGTIKAVSTPDSFLVEGASLWA